MGRTGERLYALDSLRGVAALGVAIFHYAGHLHTTPFNGVFSGLYKNGYLLVDLFFVLSGFVLARSYRRGLENGTISPAEFILRRLARMYPLHLFTLGLVVIGQACLHALGHPNFVYPAVELFSAFCNLLLIQNMGLSGPTFNGPSWSISAEFFVNLLFCVVALHRLRTAGYLVAALLSAVVIMSVWGIVGVVSQVFAHVVTAGFLRCVMGFAVGVAMEAIGRRIPRTPRTGLAMDIAAVFALAMCWVVLNRFGLTVTFLKADFLLALGLFPVSILALAHGRLAPFLLGMQPLRYLGEISYSIYMIHFPVQLFMVVVDRSILQVHFHTGVTFCTYLVLVVAASAACYHFVERPSRQAIVRHGTSLLARA